MTDEIKNTANNDSVESVNDTSSTVLEINGEGESLDAKMSDTEYEKEIVTLTDEDGNEIDFEIIGRMTLNNNDYIALMSGDNDENYLILKREVEADGAESYVTIEDDDEFDAVADAFDDEFMSEIDFDFGQDE